MHVDVGDAGAHRRNQLVELSGIQSLCSCASCRRNIRTHIIHGDCSGNSRRRRWAWLGSRRSVTQVRAEEHADPAVDAGLSQVDVRLLHDQVTNIEELVRVMPFSAVREMLEAAPSAGEAMAG